MCPIYMQYLTKEQLIRFLEQYKSEELTIESENVSGEIYCTVKCKLFIPPSSLDDTL